MTKSQSLSNNGSKITLFLFCKLSIVPIIFTVCKRIFFVNEKHNLHNELMEYFLKESCEYCFVCILMYCMIQRVLYMSFEKK